MLTILFTVMLLSVVGSMVGLALKAAWGITKVIFTILVLPIVLIAMVLCGLLPLALIVLFFMGIGSLISNAATA